MEDRIIAPNIKFLLDSKLRTMPSIMETLAEKACIEVKILSREKNQPRNLKFAEERK